MGNMNMWVNNISRSLKNNRTEKYDYSVVGQVPNKVIKANGDMDEKQLFIAKKSFLGNESPIRTNLSHGWKKNFNRSYTSRKELPMIIVVMTMLTVCVHKISVWLQCFYDFRRYCFSNFRRFI